MKIFGYMDDVLVAYYHIFDAIQNPVAHIIVALFMLILFLWVISKFFNRGN